MHAIYLVQIAESQAVYGKLVDNSILQDIILQLLLLYVSLELNVLRSELVVITALCFINVLKMADVFLHPFNYMPLRSPYFMLDFN